MSTIEIKVTAYTTKHALTSGITKEDGRLGATFIKTRNGYYGLSEFALSEEQAHAQFDLRKQKKLLSLEKQKEKLLRMEFKVK